MYSLAFDLPLTLWSQCGCQPCHCGPQWKLVGWRRSRSSVLPGRCVEPFPRPSARETAQSCRWPTQVLRADLLLQDVRTETTCIACTTPHHPSNLLSAVISSAARGALCDALRPCNKAPRAGLLLSPLWSNHPVWLSGKTVGGNYTLSPRQDTKHLRNYIACGSAIVRLKWGRGLQ